MATALFLLTMITALITISSPVHGNADHDRKSYIVYMGKRHEGGEAAALSLHLNMLQEAIGSEFSSESLLRSFKRTFNGFVAAHLTDHQVSKIAAMPGVVSVFPNRKNKLLTTRSWDFMGFTQQLARRASSESDVIIGVFDSGIWPESESFNDKGLGPPPSKWKGGACQFSPESNFTCNNKIIGAKFYRTDKVFGPGDVRSPVDSNGHGTHVAATAAGGVVDGASLYGLGKGTARGGAPSARIAVYKVCWEDTCRDGDILAAFEDAVADGVDLISVSLGSGVSMDFFEDPIAIGSFHAMKEGILTVDAAGNDGVEGLYSVRNFSPWSLTVAASTIDRQFFAQVRLCVNNSLNPELVRDKIVLCESVVGGIFPLLAGAAGSIVAMNRPGAPAENFPFPTSVLGRQQLSTILSYIRFTRNATATISKSNTGKDDQGPYIASFSSRGPNPVILDILKPDISAPGVNILAAWNPNAPITPYPGETRASSPFNLQYGTSMSCPHVTGAAAYVKSHHPDWSPAAIKSALMTTAVPMSSDNNPEAEFAYGAGHLNPLAAAHPGLIYDAGESDYVSLLCGQGYNTTVLRIITSDNSSCNNKTSDVGDLNYPSLTVSVTASERFSRVFNRVVTNVGRSNSSYRVAVAQPPEGVTVRVSPDALAFGFVGQRLKFAVTVEGVIAANSTVSGSLVWDDGVHKVRSPIVVFDSAM
ncbi:unnamed protein product [Linum grandiflorum]